MWILTFSYFTISFSHQVASSHLPHGLSLSSQSFAMPIDTYSLQLVHTKPDERENPRLPRPHPFHVAPPFTLYPFYRLLGHPPYFSLTRQPL